VAGRVLLVRAPRRRLVSGVVAADVESARRDWEDAYRRLEEEIREPDRDERLMRQLEVISDELRKRVGSRFTLGELAHEYQHADRWVRDVVAERAAQPGWPRTLSLVEGAAFHVYSRGAQDYAP
jgi:hypothetical protein